LKFRRSLGRSPALSEEQRAELKALVSAFGVAVHESTIGKWLHAFGLTRLQPRPCHPKKIAEAEEAYKNVWPAVSARDFVI
jgi:transposase